MNVERQPPSYFGSKSRRRRRWLAGAVARGNRWLDRFPLSRAFYRWQFRRQLEVVTEDVVLEGLGQELDGVTCAFLSDLHVGSYFDERDLIELFARLAAEVDPDAIWLGGDLVHTRSEEIECFRPALESVHPSLGVFAVRGNHEYFPGVDRDRWKSVLQACGAEVLDNRGVRLSRGAAGVWLAGIDDLTEGRPDLEAALRGRSSGEPTVLLSHHPDCFASACQARVDLTVSGHTHGGQIAPFGKVLLEHSESGYHRGWFEQGGSRLRVGRGLGAAILPLRIGARPELVILRLRSPSGR